MTYRDELNNLVESLNTLSKNNLTYDEKDSISKLQEAIAKAFDIIKKKTVDIDYFLTQEEFDLIKQALEVDEELKNVEVEI